MARTCVHGGVKDQLDHYSRFDKATGCILWTGATDKNGYGKLTVKYKDCRAHRLAYEQHIGPIPEGLVVCHRCDTPACINPRHLILGTHADNIADRDAKKRHVPAPGDQNGMAKLTDDDIRAIRSAKGSQSEIAAAFGICQQNVSQIKRGKRWKHVS
jgi:hypothetical protein